MASYEINFRKLAKKLWRIASNSPNLPKFFTAKVFFHTVCIMAIEEIAQKKTQVVKEACR